MFGSTGFRGGLLSRDDMKGNTPLQLSCCVGKNGTIVTRDTIDKNLSNEMRGSSAGYQETMVISGGEVTIIL